MRDAIANGSDAALDGARALLKRELVGEVARRTGVALDADKLIIGFARRATGYKRATLLFHDEKRIAPLLEAGHLQVVYSGKAHPRDFGGQELVREIVALTKKYPKSVVFVPNYDLALGRLLTRGGDVWLNTPRRPLEACGTSGMKAAMNGVLNCSILDGWWPEGCDHGVNGWAIGERLLEDDSDDGRDAAALYALARGRHRAGVLRQPRALARDDARVDRHRRAAVLVGPHGQRLLHAALPARAGPRAPPRRRQRVTSARTGTVPD